MSSRMRLRSDALDVPDHLAHVEHLELHDLLAGEREEAAGEQRGALRGFPQLEEVAVRRRLGGVCSSASSV